ncbi:hypothetical protein O7627_31120 [Solwaraspora sp. WMMD1047]|uniref:hypothetical protein n=1 Tax=Solwaraspora sp. WMMD1047 TaxID=3016102 RepID=UPI002415B0BC|nr:hypothetical protein [Solwaraspora sp. WMMD1047]MDG4833731.1 hypothetical protein [Solwaraspora sp. WMMD1047]
MTGHNPTTPGWACAGCGAEWPCPTRRRELRAEFHGSPYSLGLYLGQYFVVAAADLRHIPAGWLHNRFVGWIREPQERIPYTAVDILINSYELAKAHDPAADGTCRVCGDPADCWVRLDPAGPGFHIPVP